MALQILLLAFLVNVVLLNFVTGFVPESHKKMGKHKLCEGDDPGVPIILTPLIEAGNIEDAQMASEVYFNGFLKKKSFAGYFTVDKLYYSNHFFWFFPSEEDYANAPVVLWLQGGPGATSLIGLFVEHGPFSVKLEHGLRERQYAWTKTHSMIYMDAPAGTGYSFTNGGFAQNETKVGQDLYQSLLQFFTLFPDLQSRDFFIAGESYAGKFIPAVAHTIHQNNPEAKLKINLKGLAIGNGFCDPINQLEHAEYLYQMGLYDATTRDQVKKLEQEGIKMLQNRQWEQAAYFFDNLMDGSLSNTSVFKNVTGFNDYLNLLYTTDPLNFEFERMAKYVQRNDVRAAIHVGNASFNVGVDVGSNLIQDSVQSVAPWLSELLGHYRVVLYNGQLDIIIPYISTVNFLQKLNFSGADEYKTALRYQWRVGDDIAGYVKVAGNLTEILVRNAGHLVPIDQPQWALDLISRFTRNKPFH